MEYKIYEMTKGEDSYVFVIRKRTARKAALAMVVLLFMGIAVAKTILKTHYYVIDSALTSNHR